jgi:hypothetical protein
MKMAKSLQNKNQPAKTFEMPPDPNELKNVVRDGLTAMEVAERAVVISELEKEMRQFGLEMRGYLVPLGIPGRSPEDLTPSEVGHLIRFLRLTEPKAMRGVEKVLSRHPAFSGARGRGDKIAA